MPAKIADYKRLIGNLKTEANQAGKKYIEFSAKELMEKLDESNATLITCCSAMQQCMLEGDIMIVAPTGKKNVSTKMTIRYLCDDLSRPSSYVPKKRGRKSASKEINVRKVEVKRKIKFTQIDMMESLEQWLKRQNINYEIKSDAFHVTLPEGKWLIHIDYKKRGKHPTFKSKIYDLINALDPEIMKYSLLTPSKIAAKQEWKLMNDYAKDRLHLSILFINDQGNIKEY